MGVDGWQTLTLYGSPAELDAFEKAGYCLEKEDANLEIPPFEGVEKEYIESVLTKQRYTYCVTGIDSVKRIHKRKMEINYSFRNCSEYSFLFLVLVKYPSVCFRNWFITENGDCEQLVAQYTSKGTIRIQLYGWGGLDLDGLFRGIDFSEYRPASSNPAPTGTLKRPLHTSCVHYILSVCGPEPRIQAIARLFQAKGVKVANQKISLNVRFKTTTCKPDVLINILRKRYPEVNIYGTVYDEKGHYVEITDEQYRGYGFIEYDFVAKETEQTLNDFSLQSS